MKRRANSEYEPILIAYDWVNSRNIGHMLLLAMIRF